MDLVLFMSYLLIFLLFFVLDLMENFGFFLLSLLLDFLLLLFDSGLCFLFFFGDILSDFVYFLLLFLGDNFFNLCFNFLDFMLDLGVDLPFEAVLNILLNWWHELGIRLYRKFRFNYPMKVN